MFVLTHMRMINLESTPFAPRVERIKNLTIANLNTE